MCVCVCVRVCVCTCVCVCITAGLTIPIVFLNQWVQIQSNRTYNSRGYYPLIVHNKLHFTSRSYKTMRERERESERERERERESQRVKRR